MADSERTASDLTLLQLLPGLKAAVRLIDKTASRDQRKVMLGFLQRDLEKAALAIDQMAAELDGYRRLYRELLGEAVRIQQHDGKPIAADDDSNVRGRPPKLKPEARELWELGLSVSLANRLVAAGITCWEQLASTTYGELRTLPRVGEATAVKVLERVRLLKAQRQGS